MTGKVWLVGAGPSDIGLLTLKAKQVIEAADVVVYDALVSPEILTMVPDSAELINAGKRSSHHILRQEQTNQVLLEEAQKGKKVVRLKGGDPFLFGRGGEELQLLAEHGIPFEVVPGITSAISVPAYNGIPVTHRDFVSSVHIITGHKKADEPLHMDFEALVRLHGTLVFLMGVAAAADICQGLIGGGMSPETPAAILSRGTTAEQRRLVSDLAHLPEQIAAEKDLTPAIIVVGEVCRLADQFAWYEKKELFGCRVVITRPKDRSSRLTQVLREKGAEVIEIPAIRTERITENDRLRLAVERIDSYQWIVFTSPAGVKYFMQALAEEKKDVRRLAGVKIASLGPGTARALEEAGIYPDLMPQTYDGEHLGRDLAALLRGGERILLPRAKKGNPEIVREITKIPDVSLEDIAIYDTIYEKPRLVSTRDQFEKHPQTMAVFTSASTVHGFLAQTEGMDVSRIDACCIGRQTAAEAEKAGMRIHIAAKATIDSLAELVKEVYRGRL